MAIAPESPQPKPPVAYSIREAAAAASIGTTKLRATVAKRIAKHCPETT